MRRTIFFIFMLVFLQMSWQLMAPRMYGGAAVSCAEQSQDQPDIQWFKEEMKISPKYLEKEEGILGMSWAHFLAMAFLILFFLGALIVLYVRNKRTKEILTTLLQEQKDESKG